MGPRPPDWKLPPGVAPGTWDYVHSESIATEYETFLATTPLTSLDEKLLAEHLPHASGPGLVVADFGCGSGRAWNALSKLGYRTLGIDLSQPMLRTMRAHAAQRVDGNEHAPPPYTVRANLTRLDGFRDQSVEHGVCLFSTLGMIQGRGHRREALTHMHRMIKPGGRLLLHVHHRWAAMTEPGGVRHLIRSYLQSLRSRHWDFGDRVYAYRGLPNMFLHRFGKRELKKDLRLAGFTRLRWISINITGDATQSVLKALPRITTGGFMVIAERSAHIAP